MCLLAGSFSHSPHGPLSPYGCSQRGFLEWVIERRRARTGWKPQVQNCDSVASSVHCWSYTSALVQCGRLHHGGVTPKSGRLAATVCPPACRGSRPFTVYRPWHVSFYDCIILKSRASSSKSGPAVDGVPSLSIASWVHSFPLVSAHPPAPPPKIQWWVRHKVTSVDILVS